MPDHIKKDVPLAPLTTFEIGGSARRLVDVTNDGELMDALRWADANHERVVLIAGGSNILVPDSGLDALVIRMSGTARKFDGLSLEAHAGCNLLSLIEEASSQGLGGWEKLAGIPGSIGGAVRGNAGAFGPEIKDFVREVKAINKETREVRLFGLEACEFAYRSSFFKKNPDWIIMHVTLDLQEADPELSKKLADDTIAEREKRHLQNVHAAGSFFMNPVAPPEIVALFEAEKGVKARENRVPAGWLIEKAGLKGQTVGGAIASMQHPNYVVNEGGATAQDVRNLAAAIKQEVYNRFGIELQEEAALL
ncbi:MAG: UDP-N-acetylmuramate dehydrogenase [Candidatus Pacebacteria bacterium]|nr:UDP-N-acetylmuramate dehydrogenase [Candidatus Paceibacterota bacterium]